MQTVIRRIGTEVEDDEIIHNDVSASYEDADALAGRRVDRRKSYAIIDGELCESCIFTAPCSGCNCDCGDGYPCSHGAAGCKECGYMGKRVQSYWVPYHSHLIE